MTLKAIMKPYRVVFHLDENSEERFTEVLNNLRNLLNDLGEANIEAELVVNGNGVLQLTRRNESHLIRVRNLAKQGVHFVVCNNSLAHLKLDPSILMEEAEIVPSGVGELVRKQTEGWAYIRP